MCQKSWSWSLKADRSLHKEGTMPLKRGVKIIGRPAELRARIQDLPGTEVLEFTPGETLT